MTLLPRLRPYVITSLLLPAGALSATTLHLLDTPSADHFAYGLALSGSGTVAGYATDFESPAPLLWTKSTAGYAAPVTLPQPANAQGAELRWLSPDGALAAGFVAFGTSSFDLNYAPALWTRAGSGAYTVALLPHLGGTPAEGVVVAASANASRLVGADGSTDTATVWRGTPSGGYYAQALPLPGGSGGPSFATAASADGARLAGRFTATGSATRALVWTEANGAYSALALAAPAGAAQTFAEALSADGKLVVGSSESANLFTAVKWDAATGQATLLEARAGADTTALSVSSDNYWIGGRATQRSDSTHSAVLWNADGKVFTLASLATAVNFGGFVPGDVSAIHTVSPGVYTVAGTGVTLATGQTRAFVVENLALPVPATPTTPPPTTPTDPVVTDPVVPAPGPSTPKPTLAPGSRRRGGTATTTWERFDTDPTPLFESRSR